MRDPFEAGSGSPRDPLRPLRFGAAELARQIRSGALSVTQVTDAHIDRIEAVNPRINAVVTPMFESAREAAAECDRRIATEGTGDLPPLFGVPVTVKDCWPVAGVRFTAGSWYHRGDVAERDAEVVRRLREAGAIVLGKTNCPDMVFGVETVNPIFGRTRNPHALGHSAGGSSGGEGAIIAAGGSPLGIGSDIGGSVRVPAGSNGCVALKPTTGRVPADDHVPETNATVLGWNHAGVIARRVEDLALALEVLSSRPSRPVGDVPLEGVPCVVCIRNGLVPVSRQVVEAVVLAAHELGSLGMQVVREDSLLLYRLTAVWTALMSRHDIPDLRRQLGGGRDFSTIGELAAGLRGKPRISPESLASTNFVRLSALLARLTGDHTFERLAEHKRHLLETMGGGILLCPVLLTPPPRRGSSYRPTRQTLYVAPFNATGMPAAVVPIRWTDNGLPLAVQVVAPEGEDELALAVAAQLERAFGGWRMAPLPDA